MAGEISLGSATSRVEFNPLVSFYPNAFENLPTDIEAAKFIAEIKGGTYASLIKEIRQRFQKAVSRGVPYADAKKAVDSQKKKLAAITLAGTQPMRGNKFAPLFTGLIQADFDLLGDRLQYTREMVADDPHVFTLFLSATGEGLKAFYRIPICKNADEYKFAFDTLAAHVLKFTGRKIDELKEVARLCYASHDKDCFHNPNSIELPVDFAQMPPPADEAKKAAKLSPSNSSPINGESRRSIAERIFGKVAWESDVLGYCACLGENLHTTGNAPKDCRITLDGSPTVYCLHKSCLREIEKANHELRSQVGKAEWTPAIKIEATDGDSFDKITSDVRGDILGTLSDKNTTPSAQRREICASVIAALNRVGRFYYHAELRDFDSALFFNRFTKRLERLHADSFLSWLSEWLCINRADALFRFVIAAVENEALSRDHATGILPESFWASRPAAIYISNGDGQAAKITADGVRLVDNGSDGVLFPVGRTCQSWRLVAPKDIFETCGIFRDVHAIAGHAPDLLRAWIYSLPSNPKSKPPLCLAGEIGSGKTRLAKAIAEFYGLPFVAAKVEESEENNFWPAVDAGGLFTLDNADTKCRWLADALANAATDGCSQRRRLYTNAETITLRARAWLAVTTANPSFAADSGLADRLLLVRMARRDEEATSDAALTDEILANRDAGLSHLAETLRAALADTAPTPAGLNQRHPDFSAFAVRIGRALNREAQMIEAMKNAEADKSLFCLENDNIGAALLACLGDGETFTGTAGELREKIIATDADLTDKLSAKRLGKRLSALWPHLKKQLTTAKQEKDRKGFSIYTFKKANSAEYAEFQTRFS